MPYTRRSSYGRRYKKKSPSSSKNKVPRKYKTSRYKPGARNNKSAIVALQRDVRKLKKVDGLMIHQDYYDQQLAVSGDQFINRNSVFLTHEALTEFSTYQKMWDKFEQWNESNTVFIKNMRINYFLRMRSASPMAGPIYFTMFVYSPKALYKKIGITPNNFVNDPSNWERRKEYFYDQDPRNANGVINVMLNPNYFEVHAVKTFKIVPKFVTTDPYTGPTSAHVMDNTDPMDITRQGQIKLRINKKYKFTARTASENDDWTNIDNERIPLTKQYYITCFHSGVSKSYGEMGDPTIDLVYTNRITVKQVHQKSKNVINNEIDAA